MIIHFKSGDKIENVAYISFTKAGISYAYICPIDGPDDLNFAFYEEINFIYNPDLYNVETKTLEDKR